MNNYGYNKTKEIENQPFKIILIRISFRLTTDTSTFSGKMIVKGQKTYSVLTIKLFVRCTGLLSFLIFSLVTFPIQCPVKLTFAYCVYSARVLIVLIAQYILGNLPLQC